MKKLFENISGNSFKLLTENTVPSNNGMEKVKGADVLREGLRKVFSQGNPEITYFSVQNMGLGFIKDVSQAKLSALQESRELALEHGYVDDSENAKFVLKEHDETNMNNPEEKREVQIGKEIKSLYDICVQNTTNDEILLQSLNRINELATELIRMHGAV